MRKSLLRVLPWLVTAGLLFLLFRRISFSAVVAGVHNAAGWTVPVTLLCVAAIYVADSFAIWKTFGWFLTRMSFSDVLLVRGATYLLAAINYNVGQGAIVYFVHRNKGTTIMRGVATILLVLGVNVLALLFLTTGVLPVAPGIPKAVKVLVADRVGRARAVRGAGRASPPLARPPAVRGAAQRRPRRARARARGPHPPHRGADCFPVRAAARASTSVFRCSMRSRCCRSSSWSRCCRSRSRGWARRRR